MLINWYNVKQKVDITESTIIDLYVDFSLNHGVSRGPPKEEVQEYRAEYPLLSQKSVGGGLYSTITQTHFLHYFAYVTPNAKKYCKL